MSLGQDLEQQIETKYGAYVDLKKRAYFTKKKTQWETTWDKMSMKADYQTVIEAKCKDSERQRLMLMLRPVATMLAGADLNTFAAVAQQYDDKQKTIIMQVATHEERSLIQAKWLQMQQPMIQEIGDTQG